jgi:hypothetical protein
MTNQWMMYENVNIDYTCHGSLYYDELQHTNNGIKNKSECSPIHNNFWIIMEKNISMEYS